MKIKIWIVSTCNPESNEPCLPTVFTSEAEAEAYADKMMRCEWETNGPQDDDGRLLAYPGDWREAQDQIIEWAADDCTWGQWEITSHELDVPDPVPAETAGKPNASRVRRAEVALTAYQASYEPREGGDGSLCDLLTDLRHWADANNVNYEREDGMAHCHWCEEDGGSEEEQAA